MQALVSEAPWWGASLVAAVALLIGSGLTLLVTWLRGRADQALTDKRRWDDLILDSCVEVERLCAELVGISRHGWPRCIADSDERMNRYVELLDQLNTAQNRFRYAASDGLKKASLELFKAGLTSLSE